MLIKEPRLVCDQCLVEIVKGERVIFVFEGNYDGIQNTDEPILDDSMSMKTLEWHIHLTCLDEWVNNYWDVGRGQKR